MLVGAFEIKIGVFLFRPMGIDGVLDHEGMGRAGIEPDVENIGDLFVIVFVMLAEKTRRGR